MPSDYPTSVHTSLARRNRTNGAFSWCCRWKCWSRTLDLVNGNQRPSLCQVDVWNLQFIPEISKWKRGQTNQRARVYRQKPKRPSRRIKNPFSMYYTFVQLVQYLITISYIYCKHVNLLILAFLWIQNMLICCENFWEKCELFFFFKRKSYQSMP